MKIDSISLLLFGLFFYAVFRKDSVNGIGGMSKSKFLSPYEGTRARFASVKNKSGVYLIKENNVIVYVGHSQSNLYKTLYRHFQSWNHPYQKVTTYKDDMNSKDYTVRVIVTTASQAPRLEAYLINKYQPRDNDQKLSLLAEMNTGATEYKKMKVADEVPF